MTRKIIGDRLKKLLRDKKISQEKFAEMVGVKRETICQICNDKYEPTPRQNTFNRIYNALAKLGYGDSVNLYLSGEVEYNDIDSFSSDSTPARMYRAASMIDSVLDDMLKAELLDDRIHYRVYGADHNDYIDMNIAEYQGFKYHLLRQIESSCQNYIDVCKLHDDRTDQRVLR